MAGRSTKDKAMEQLDMLMAPFKPRPDAFTIQDMAKRYHFSRHRAYMLVTRLIEDGLIEKVDRNHYILTSLAQKSGRAVGPKSRSAPQQG